MQEGHVFCKSFAVMTSDDQYIQKLITLSRELIDLAAAGGAASDDDGCLLVFGIAQDCGYKIHQLATRELELHDRCGHDHNPET